MNTQILIGLLLTILPVSELRGGLPVIAEYTIRNGLSIWPYFLMVLVLNILIILVVFLFLDSLHKLLMKIGIYRKIIGKVLNHLQRKIKKLQQRMDKWGYLALTFFVAVPLPGTGAWTGTLIAWTLGLNRWKSFIAIALGVIIAGFLVLFASLGFFSKF